MSKVYEVVSIPDNPFGDYFSYNSERICVGDCVEVTENGYNILITGGLGLVEVTE